MTAIYVAFLTHISTEIPMMYCIFLLHYVQVEVLDVSQQHLTESLSRVTKQCHSIIKKTPITFPFPSKR